MRAQLSTSAIDFEDDQQVPARSPSDKVESSGLYINSSRIDDELAHEPMMRCAQLRAIRPG